MIFYQTPDGLLYPTQAEAKAIDREFTQVDIPTDKAGLMAHLNELYRRYLSVAEPERFNSIEISHVDPDPEPVPPPPPPAPTYTAVSISIDEAWAELPLARQLHFAELALNEARHRIK